MELTMENLGIDYGMGRTNIDRATGIRYGCISQNSILQAWANRSEPYYGAPRDYECPTCGKPLDCQGKQWGEDVTCENCKESCEIELPDMAEPISYTYDGNGYVARSCLDTDVVLVKSPYYTYTQFCSPCVPGAGNLDSPMEGGVKTYAFGHNWFEDGKAPYPLYKVCNGEREERAK